MTLAEKFQEVEEAIIYLDREADFIALADPAFLSPNRDLIEHARERLNDALAKLERIAA